MRGNNHKVSRISGVFSASEKDRLDIGVRVVSRGSLVVNSTNLILTVVGVFVFCVAR